MAEEQRPLFTEAPGLAPSDRYRNLVPPGSTPYRVELTAAETCAVLYAHDYGIDHLAGEDRQRLESALAALKEAIWP